MVFLYTWIQDVAVYVILVSLITNLLPKNQYEKYVRLFTGMVLIILLMKPVSTFLKLSDDFDTFFSLDIYKQELKRWELDFGDWDEIYEYKMMEGYEIQVKQQLELLLQEENYELGSVEVEFEKDTKGESYGKIAGLKISLKDKGDLISDSPFSFSYENLETTRIKEKVCEYYQLEKEQVEIYGV